MVTNATATNDNAAGHACPAAYLLNAATYLRTSAEWALTLAESNENRLRGSVVVAREELSRHAKTLLSHADVMTEAANASPEETEVPSPVDLLHLAEQAEEAGRQGKPNGLIVAHDLYASVWRELKRRMDLISEGHA